MALDAQSNWNVEMSQPMKLSIRSREPEMVSKSSYRDEAGYLKPPSREIRLPLEIISHILSFIPIRASNQSTFHACTLVSRLWYSASIALLYQRPYLTGGNFNSFVTTVCPSKNAHIRQSHLAVLVRRLDMGELVHNSSKSLTARLLGRLKGNIEEFVAPQASFAINSFAALSKCTKLRHLDLSLISASISNDLLFQTLKNLTELETLFFPRSSSSDAQNREKKPYSWPPKLKALHLAGGVDDHFLHTHLSNVPTALTHFSIQHCSMVYSFALLSTLETIGLRLQHLTIRHPMSRIGGGALDHVLLSCPSLIAFRISADFITNALFQSIPTGHPLRILDLDCSGTAGAEVEISAGKVYDAVDAGRLPDLRSVRVSSRLAWGATQRGRQDMKDLMDIMEENDDENPLDVYPIGVFTSYD
ncbi:hypothetical protein ACMFMG_009581 [Clarireedia jacksonii]